MASEAINTPKLNKKRIDTMDFGQREELTSGGIDRGSLPHSILHKLNIATLGFSDNGETSDRLFIHRFSGNQRAYHAARTLYKDGEKSGCKGTIIDLRGSDELGEMHYHGSFAIGTNTYDRISVSKSETAAPFRGMGYAERRIIMVHEYCMREYGRPLCSSVVLSDDAKRLWKRLEERGLAEKARTIDGKDYFVFKKEI